MAKHGIRSDSRAFQLLTRLLTIDPTKRLSGMDLALLPTFDRANVSFAAADAMNDLYFKEDPKPTDE